MMTATMAFIRGETAAASKKKVHTPWKSQDQSKRHTSERRSDFRNQPKDGRGSNKFTPLTRTPKEIFAAESGKFKPPPPMVTPVEKRSSNKFCEFHNDKGHSIDECMQLRKHIEELVRAGKLSHFIKEIRQDRDQQKTGTKDALIFAHVKEITFPPLTANKGTEGPLVIEAKISGHAIHHMYVDGGSSMEWGNYMAARTVKALGNYRRRRAFYESMDEFYNSEVTVTVQRMLKFPVNGGIVTIRSTILTPTECATIAVTPKDSAKKAEARYKNFKVAIHPDFLDQEITIGGTISTKIRTELCTLLKGNLDIFAWQSSNMTGKKRGQAPERAKAIQVEVQKLVEAGILREVYYHDWLFNLVMVKKHDGSWRICVDFTNLNKACSQDCYPLPEIDWKVESLCGYPYKCFLDAYKGYHQIQMAEQDEEKMAFHTSHGVYCYTKMPFGLKNADATYQRLVDKAFDRQIGQNLEIYVDDLVIKSHTETELLRDIEETFRYMISPEGIKPCPDKTEAVFQLPSPRTIKECGFDDQKGHSPDTGLFREPSAASSRAKLYPNGKASPSASLRRQKVTQLLPGASHCSHHRPARQASDITSRRSRAITKMERHARGSQYHISAANICEGPDLADFLVEKPDDALPEASFTYALRFQFAASNNEVEYEALIAGLRITARMGIRNVQVPRSKNKKADALSKIASTSFTHLSKQVLVEILKEKSIQEKEVAAVAIQYELLEGILYRRSFLKTWLRCVGPLQADYVIQEIHEGSCDMYAGPRSVVAKAMRSGYYWPTMHRDARDMIRKCKGCRIHRPVPRHPQQPLTPITAPWPFYKWGIDIASPFPEGPGKVKFLIVAMDYFTKWIEAKVVATISGSQVKKFVWDNIVCRFGLPREIISENGKQFSGDPFKDWCEKLNIVQRFTSVKHPQSNGLVERANRSLGEGIKARLGEGNKNWLEELPHVLWAHHTMIKSSNDDTSFSLTYGTEAVIPAEIEMPTYRTAVGDAVHNDEELRLNLDLLEERRKRAAIREAKAKLNMTKYYNAKVRGVTFRPKDFVYRSNDASHAVDGGKLGPKWEGPYEVTEALGDGAYKLRSTDGTVLPRTWNIANLKKCYL
ncbi:reverse transcriptase domain-containing protein [Tanacetum coccineum]